MKKEKLENQVVWLLKDFLPPTILWDLKKLEKFSHWVWFRVDRAELGLTDRKSEFWMMLVLGL